MDMAIWKIPWKNAILCYLSQISRSITWFMQIKKGEKFHWVSVRSDRHTHTHTLNTIQFLKMANKIIWYQIHWSNSITIVYQNKWLKWLIEYRQISNIFDMGKHVAAWEVLRTYYIIKIKLVSLSAGSSIRSLYTSSSFCFRYCLLLWFSLFKISLRYKHTSNVMWIVQSI